MRHTWAGVISGISSHILMGKYVIAGAFCIFGTAHGFVWISLIVFEKGIFKSTSRL